MAKKKPIPLEETLAQLEATVEAIDSDELKLEDALAAFEKGIKLIRDAQLNLEQAEQRVTQLIDKGGQPVEEPLADDSETAE